MQKECVLAAKASIITVEEIVDDLDAHPNACVLPHWTIDAIASCQGARIRLTFMAFYDRDNVTYVEWDAISADREKFQAWMQANVLDVDETVFANVWRP